MKDIKKRKLFCGAASLICAIAFRLALPAGVQTYYSISPLPIFVAVAYYFLFQKTVASTKLQRTSCIIASCALALLVSCCFVIGAQFCSGIDNVKLLSIFTFAGIMFNAVPLYSAMVIFWEYLDKRASNNSTPVSEMKLLSKRALLLFALQLLCWAPILFLVYPGQFGGDVGSLYLGEWSQWESGELNNHHPILHTILMCSIIELGMSISSFNFGVFLFSLFQGICCAAIFTYILVWLKNHSCPRWLIVASFVYFCLSPTVSWFVFFSNCDTLFSALALWFGVKLYDMVKLDYYDFKSFDKSAWLTIVGCVISGSLFCCMRPNGVYALLASTPFLILFAKHSTNRKCLLASLVTVFLVFWVWMNPISDSLDVEDSELQKLNAFSVPIQQMAYVSEYGGMTDEELESLKNDGYRDNNKYKQDLADLARGRFSKMSKMDILKNYVIIGLHHPGAYAKAFILQTSYLWNPYGYVRSVSASCEINRDYSIEEVYEGNDDPKALWFFFGASEPSELDSGAPELYNKMHKVASSLFFQNIPVVSMLVSLPFYIFLLLLSFLRAATRSNKGAISTLILFLFLTLSAFLGPGIIVRYYIYLLFGLPLLLFFLVDGSSRNQLSSDDMREMRLS